MERNQLDELNLDELVDALEDLEERRTPVGWSPDDAVLRSSIERRILALVSGRPAPLEQRKHVRVECDLPVTIRSKRHLVRSQARDIGVGGILVDDSSDFAEGTVVDLEIRGDSDEHGLRVRGTVAWLEPDGRAGVSFSDFGGISNERRLRRFVLEALRRRIH